MSPELSYLPIPPLRLLFSSESASSSSPTCGRQCLSLPEARKSPCSSRDPPRGGDGGLDEAQPAVERVARGDRAKNVHRTGVLPVDCDVEGGAQRRGDGDTSDQVDVERPQRHLVHGGIAEEGQGSSPASVIGHQIQQQGRGSTAIDPRSTLPAESHAGPQAPRHRACSTLGPNCCVLREIGPQVRTSIDSAHQSIQPHRLQLLGAENFPRVKKRAAGGGDLHLGGRSGQRKHRRGR